MSSLKHFVVKVKVKLYLYTLWRYGEEQRYSSFDS